MEDSLKSRAICKIGKAGFKDCGQIGCHPRQDDECESEWQKQTE